MGGWGEGHRLEKSLMHGRLGQEWRSQRLLQRAIHDWVLKIA